MALRPAGRLRQGLRGSSPGRKEGALSPLSSGGEEDLGQHDGCPLGEDRPVPLVGLEKKMGRAGEKLVFGLAAVERIKGVADTCRVENKNRPQGRSVACGLGEELAL